MLYTMYTHTGRGGYVRANPSPGRHSDSRASDSRHFSCRRDVVVWLRSTCAHNSQGQAGSVPQCQRLRTHFSHRHPAQRPYRLRCQERAALSVVFHGYSGWQATSARRHVHLSCRGCGRCACAIGVARISKARHVHATVHPRATERSEQSAQSTALARSWLEPEHRSRCSAAVRLAPAAPPRRRARIGSLARVGRRGRRAEEGEARGIGAPRRSDHAPRAASQPRSSWARVTSRT